MTSQNFHIGDILTITTGKLLSPRYIDGLYDILGFLSGDNLMTHQLVPASDVYEPYLKEQFPSLATIVVPEGLNTEALVLEWLGHIAFVHGEQHEITAAPELWGTHDALQDMIDIRTKVGK